MLVKQRDLMPFYWSDATQIEQALASGEIVAAYAWNDAVGALKEQGIPIAFMTPKEGSLPWVCGLVLHKDAQAVDLAYDFMDAMLARSEEHTSELQSLMRISYAVFCLQKKNTK